ncbi:ATP-binding protein [Aromatoleum petrolei]|uniref:histidine kinase n=1 Tax=Aromatoleum petrolei TaxID=76116 RepID=A0ABX1MUH9_9RHOO|nr:ATP-binding protein [Aromatoleum petrolei]NMF90895.1 sensor histidine kinase [Aromatoleum petrolei]QTQ36362.1 Two component system sensor histidine kinase [Aromatoleum petrolei]
MRFRLVRYFTLASLGMFGLVALSLIYFEREQSQFYKHTNDEQLAFFGEVQQSFAKQQEEAARRDLLTIHESGNVNLTRLFANALWERDFAPFVADVQAIDVDHCKAIADVADENGKKVAPPEKKACFADVGKRIMALPDFKSIDAKVFASMKKSTVFKIKVFDLRGITVYSSEHAQMGEDKSTNEGWRGAAFDGVPKSELTHRGKFSAFEGVVENRDLISSYLPVLEPGTSRIVGVFEVYSDVTPFLKQIQQTSGQIRATAIENQNKLGEAAAANQEAVDATSYRQFATIAGLLALLFAALLAIVRRAEGIIDQQEADRAHAHQQLAQSEKMASLGQMVAGVAHQLNTPLAFSQNNILMVKDALQSMELPMKVAGRLSSILEDVDGDKVTIKVSQLRANLDKLQEGNVDVTMLQEMLKDVLGGIDQMSELVVNLRDFTRLDRAATTNADLNKALHTVAYIAQTVLPKNIELVEEYGELPSVECNPSQLNQVFLNLINNAAQAIDGPGRIRIRSFAEGDQVHVEVQDNGRGIPDDVLPHIFDLYYTTKPAGEGTGLGLAIARNIVTEHGGDITVSTRMGVGTTFTVTLPVRQQAPLAQAA